MNSAVYSCTLCYSIHSKASGVKYLDLIIAKEFFNNRPIFFIQSGMVQANTKLQGVP